MPVQTSLLCKDRESQLAGKCNLHLSTCPTSEGWNEPTCPFCLPVPTEDNFAPFPKLYLLFAGSRILLPMPVSMHQHLPKQQRKGQPGEADPWAAEHTRSVLWRQTYLGASEGSGTEGQVQKMAGGGSGVICLCWGLGVQTAWFQCSNRSPSRLQQGF